MRGATFPDNHRSPFVIRTRLVTSKVTMPVVFSRHKRSRVISGHSAVPPDEYTLLTIENLDSK